MSDTLERAGTAAPRPELDWERDWQGRPRILADPTWTVDTAPPGWVVDGALLSEREYTRVTTHAEALQDSSALTRWKLRRALLGMARRPDYVTAAAALSTRDEDRDALDDLAEKCLEAAGPNAADIGTALHAFTERLDRGEDVGAVPAEYRSTLDAYARAIRHLTFLEFECRTVCDELEAAGTPDRVGLCDVPDPDGETEVLRIIDTKTGRVDYSAGKFSTQLATYRRSKLYHPGTGKRTSWEEAHGLPVSPWGLVIHAPAGAGFAELLWIWLGHGGRGAEIALDVRDWRKGAKASALLRPVFARAPRPRPQDGTCRGRKATDGTACGYRRKSKADGLGAQFCGRHQDQAADLERWLAENPDADPDAGVEQEPSRDPVHTEYVKALQAGADDAMDRFRAEAERHGVLVSTRTLPNGYLVAEPGAVAVSPDGVQWRKVQRSDAYGWEREDQVILAGGPEHVRCLQTDLLVTQCACSVHRPELEHGLDGYDAADTDGTDDVAPAHELPDALPQGPVGTYALDPATEVNGTPRPVSGLQEPADAFQAADAARAAVLRQIAVARSGSELELIWQRHHTLWTPDLTAAAGARARQIQQEQQRAKPEAALLAALETAQTEQMLATLWQEYGHTSLWTAECGAAASHRVERLRAAAQL